MADLPPSIISHVSLGTNDFERAAAFYDAVMSTIGAKRILEHGDAVGYGRAFPEFWINTPLNEGTANAGNGTHVAFLVESRDVVHAFYEAALAAGGTCDGPPGPRPQYGEPYYACFVRDLDGHKIEAMVWEEDLPT